MSDQSTTRQLVIFSLGEEEYALPITHVHEIIRWTEPRTVASEDPSVRGVISLRGKILPVFDLSTRLNLAAEPADNRKIVIVETPSAMAGVIVDDVEEVLTVDDEQLDATGGWTTLTGEGIEGIAKLDDRLVVLLDPERIVARDLDVSTPAAAVPAADGRAASATAVAA